MAQKIDPSFLLLQPEKLAKKGLDVLRQAGATYGDFRLERIQTQIIGLHDLELENVLDETEIGFALRVIVNGTWGFAASSKIGRAHV